MRLWCSRPHRASAGTCRRMQRTSSNPEVWPLVSITSNSGFLAAAGSGDKLANAVVGAVCSH